MAHIRLDSDQELLLFYCLGCNNLVLAVNHRQACPNCEHPRLTSKIPEDRLDFLDD